MSMDEKDLLAGADTTDPLADDSSTEDRGDTLAPESEQETTDGGDHGSSQQRQQPDQSDESEGSEPAGTAGADESDPSGDAADDGGDNKQPQQDHRIPKSRFDEVNRRRKEAERRLQELERQQKAQDPAKAVDFDFDAKEQEYMQAVLDGETEKALNIRKEIRSAEAALQEAKVQQAQQEAQHKTKAQLELEQTVMQAQQQFPEFDASSDVYDEEATQEALELFEAYKGRGYLPGDAMNRAVRMTARAYGLGQQHQHQQQDQQASQKKQQKQAESLDEKMKTAEKQPPAPSQERDNAELPVKDPLQMSEKEFDALDEQERRRLRGDFG